MGDIFECDCFVRLLGPVLCGSGDSRLHLPRNPAGHGGREGQVRARVRLVVPGRLYVRDAVRGDTVLRRVSGRDLWEDYESQGEVIRVGSSNIKVKSFLFNKSLNTLFTGAIPVPTAGHRRVRGR